MLRSRAAMPSDVDAKVTETSRHQCFDGWQIFARHPSAECGGVMKFSVYLPPAAARGRVPVLYYLVGLTCTEETFVIKAGAKLDFGSKRIAPIIRPYFRPSADGQQR